MLPNLPTDSLYKFAALAGLVIAAAAIGWPVSAMLELKHEQFLLRVEHATHHIEEDSLAELEDLLEGQIATLDRMIAEGEGGGLQAIGAERALEHRDALTLRLHEAKRDGRIKHTEGELKDARVAEIERHVLYLLAFLVLSAAGGLVLSYTGFKAWYLRVQAPQDQLLVKEVAKHRETSHPPAPRGDEG